MRSPEGISIHIKRPLWRAALHVIGDFAEGGLEGILVLILAPVLAVGAIYFAFIRFAMHEGGPELVVRAGRITYRDTQVQHEPLRECAVSDVVAIKTDDARPIIRKRGGNELLGGFDAIEVDGYRRLNAAEKRCVTQTLRVAVGLPLAADDASGETIG